MAAPLAATKFLSWSIVDKENWVVFNGLLRQTAYDDTHCYRRLTDGSEFTLGTSTKKSSVFPHKVSPIL